MINTLFLEKSEILNHEKALLELQTETIKYEKGLFIMKYKGTQLLIWSCVPYTISPDIEKKISLWCFHPVYKNKELKNLNDFPPPIIIALENINIDNNIFKAKCIENNDEIQIQRTNKSENIIQYEMYNQTMRNAETDLKQLYWNVLEKKIGNEVSKFIYQNW